MFFTAVQYFSDIAWKLEGRWYRRVVDFGGFIGVVAGAFTLAGLPILLEAPP